MQRLRTHRYIKIASFLLVMIPLNLQILRAGDRTTAALDNETLVLTDAGELHLTSSTNPLINSSIDIQHEDAWVFFDNIKPSDVINNHISAITIDGAALNKDTNARIAIYGHGTVIMAHGSNFKPLTVFNQEAFKGDSLSLELNTFHNKLQLFDNSIQSFKLKRGYMATLANETNGTGYSRVFIADTQDLNINVVQDELHGTVSFIRVLKWQWVNKKGKAGWDPHFINGTCYYDWNIGGNSSDDVEYSVIRQNAGWPSWSAINAKKNVSHVLGFNEPDRPDQSYMSFASMIGQWPEFMKSGLRIGSPAWASEWNGAPDGGGNLFDFIDECDELNYRVDFVALHCYWVKSPQQWYESLKYIHERTGRPLWITEWNNGANWTKESWPDANRSYTAANAQKQLNDMKRILQVLDTASFVERYFIYDWVQDCRAMVYDGQLTKAGQYYADNPSEIAYTQAHEVIPHWNFVAPELSYSYSSSTNKVTLEWLDRNGELSTGYKLERKLNDAEYTELYVSDDNTVLTYMDTIDTPGMGSITYRLSTKTKSGNYIPSNEVSYYQTAKEETVEFGRFSLNNSEWQTCLYEEKSNVLPIILLGVPSNNNRSIPLTQRVTSMTTKYFKFRVDPWDYLNNPEITTPEEFPLMAIPTGVYDFGSLKLQAKSATSIKGAWKPIVFAEPFHNTPVVFCTQTSNYTTFPTSIAIRNVTTTGFEVRLMKEESKTGSISSERIHYIAVTPGEGIIGKKRVVVGQTETTVGDIYSTHEIVFDDSYVNPVVFGGLQTANDDITSTLRFYYSSDKSIKVFKSRERSVSATKVSKDKLGFMMVDLSDNQPLALKDIKTFPSIKVFPNPTSDLLYFNLKTPTYLEVYDQSGQRQMVGTVKTSLDISSLASGNYTIHIKGIAPVKITKL